jgi:hypothetical protein
MIIVPLYNSKLHYAIVLRVILIPPNGASHFELIVMRLISQLVVIQFSETPTVKKYRFPLRALSYR